MTREETERAELTKIEACIREYYDSLSDEEREADRAWGEFALAQLLNNSPSPRQ